MHCQSGPQALIILSLLLLIAYFCCLISLLLSKDKENSFKNCLLCTLHSFEKSHCDPAAAVMFPSFSPAFFPPHSV